MAKKITNQSRPDSKKNPLIGKSRQQRYKHVLARYKKAMDDGYYIEAVALMDSVICDRLESLLIEITQNNACVNGNLSRLIDGLKKNNSDFTNELNLTIDNICDWKYKRNVAVHEIAKLQAVAPLRDFNTKYAENELFAKEGKTLFRKIDNEIRKYKKLKK